MSYEDFIKNLFFVYKVAEQISKAGKETKKQWGVREKIPSWDNSGNALERDPLSATYNKKLLLAKKDKKLLPAAANKKIPLAITNKRPLSTIKNK